MDLHAAALLQAAFFKTICQITLASVEKFAVLPEGQDHEPTAHHRADKHVGVVGLDKVREIGLVAGNSH